MAADPAEGSPSDDKVHCGSTCASLPNDQIVQTLKGTMTWDVELAGLPQIKGNGKRATKRAMVKSDATPVADAIQVREMLVSIKSDLTPDLVTRQNTQHTFFGTADAKKAADIVTKDKFAPPMAKAAAMAYFAAKSTPTASAAQPLSFCKPMPGRVTTETGRASAASTAVKD